MIPHHQLNALRELERMQSDVHWLGWCYHHDAPLESPLCMHAYAVTVKGARDLLNATETCGPAPLDRQVRELCNGPDTVCSMTHGAVVHHKEKVRAEYFLKEAEDKGL